MAKKATKKDYPPRNQKYPWKCWLDGEWHEIEHGKDFQVPINNMRISMLTYARNNGFVIETRALVDGKTLAFRKVGSKKPPVKKKATKPKVAPPCPEKNTTNV